MKKRPVIIDSPKTAKSNTKIFGNLCGMKTVTRQTKDFDDFFEPKERHESKIDPQILSRMEDYVKRYPESRLIEDFDKYSVIEDFCCILFKEKKIPQEKFLPHRSEGSCRSRYYKKLSHLTNKNLRDILKHLDENGVENKSLSFLKQKLQGIIEGDNRIILLDSEEESKQKEEDNFSHSIENNEVESQIQEKQSNLTSNDIKQSESPQNSLEEKSKEEQYHTSNSHEKSDSKEMEIENNENENEDDVDNNDNDNANVQQEKQKEETFFKLFCKTLSLLINVDKNKLLPCLISKENESNSSLIKKENFSIMRNFNTNKREILNAPAEALHILLKLEQKFNKSATILLQDLYKVSGNINDLVEFYEDPEKMDYITWNIDEDQILEKAISPNENSFKLLLRYKGVERVKSRIKFKHFKKNFEL